MLYASKSPKSQDYTTESITDSGTHLSPYKNPSIPSAYTKGKQSKIRKKKEFEQTIQSQKIQERRRLMD